MVSLLSHVHSATLWTVAHQSLCSWTPPGKKTGVGCHFLLQVIFPTQGLNPSLWVNREAPGDYKTILSYLTWKKEYCLILQVEIRSLVYSNQLLAVPWSTMLRRILINSHQYLFSITGYLKISKLQTARIWRKSCMCGIFKSLESSLSHGSWMALPWCFSLGC